MESNPVRHDQLGYFMRTEVDYERTKKQKSYYIIKMEISLNSQFYFHCQRTDIKFTFNTSVCQEESVVMSEYAKLKIQIHFWNQPQN